MTGRLLKFDQEEFFQSASGASMEDFGFVYIPPACEDGSLQCRLHVFFHGCTMQHQVIGTDFITNAGFIEIADANNIVVLFPQTIAKTLSGNPNGCFNWFGYLVKICHDVSNRLPGKNMNLHFFPERLAF